MTKIADGECFAILAPPQPEPVMHRFWINLYPTFSGLPFDTEEQANSNAAANRVECRCITWMSDGSPVPASPEQFDQMREMAVLAQDRDEWRTKAEDALSLLRQANDRVEALQAEAGRLGNDLLSAIDRRAEAELEARSLKADLAAAREAIKWFICELPRMSDAAKTAIAATREVIDGKVHPMVLRSLRVRRFFLRGGPHR